MTADQTGRARQRRCGTDDPASPALMFAEIQNELGSIFAAIDWAEDEIAKARKRHPRKPELWATFDLLLATHELMRTEFVYRAHCRELLERVAAGQDTRPATDAEVAIACAGASELAPLTQPAIGLYFRVWSRAFPAHAVVDSQTRSHYEALHGPQIDELENTTRRKARQDWRRFDRERALAQVHDRRSNNACLATRLDEVQS
jgi:hypothetical protein